VLAAVAVAASGATVLATAYSVERGGLAVAMAPFALLVLVYLPSIRWPRPAALGLGGLVVLALVAVETRRPAVVATRSFYAAYRVVRDEDAGLQWLAHGRTIHGAESTRRPGQCLPYHHPHSPAAAVFGDLPPAPRVAIVGLGIGCMADLAPADATIDFIEIDAEVERLARAHFSALPRCGNRCTVTLADGRVALAASPHRYDLVVLDAFASDAIPVHLLTTEALRVYADHLRPGGSIAVHVTNRHVDLTDVVVATAAAVSLAARVLAYAPRRDTVMDPTVVEAEYAATRFVLLTRDGSAPPARPEAGLSVAAAPPPRARPWTDTHAPLRDLVLGR
jgi:spermidine synthase